LYEQKHDQVLEVVLLSFLVMQVMVNHMVQIHQHQIQLQHVNDMIMMNQDYQMYIGIMYDLHDELISILHLILMNVDKVHNVLLV
jgi:hypothetical protein